MSFFSTIKFIGCLTLALFLCNGTADNPSGTAQAQLFADQLDNEPALAARFKRQIAYPNSSPQQQPSGDSGFLSSLAQLGPQLAQAQQISSLLSGGNNGNNPQPAGFLQQLQGPSQQQQPASSLSTAASLVGQLGNLIRSTPDRQTRALEATQQTAQQSVQQAAQTIGQAGQNAAQTAQGGIQSALIDLSTGLQRIANNNPNLVPDVKSLYQSVSSKLSSSQGQTQFANNVAQQVANPQPLPSPTQ